MSDLHRNSRFLRFLRSICAKTAYARRAIVALFVAIATILATFMIMPSASMGASPQSEPKQVQTQNGNAENKPAETAGAPAKDGAGAKGEAGDSKTKESNTAEPKNPQPSANTDASNADHTKNVDSTKQQQNNGVEGVNNNLNKGAATAKGAEKSKSANNALRRQKRELGNTRAAAGKVELPSECKALNKKSFKSCYEISYDFGTANTVDNGKTILIKRGNTIIIKPKFEIKLKGNQRKPATMPSGVWFKLEKYLKDPVPSWANFEKTENDKTIKVKSTKDQTDFDGSITLSPNGKWDYGSYEFKVFAYYKNENKDTTIYTKISVKVNLSDDEKSHLNNDLSLSLYDFGNAQDNAAVTDNKITIKPKSNSSGAGGSDTGSADNKDTYNPINKLFIDSKSTKKLGFIYHRMICKTGSGDNASYTVDSVNGLSLKDKKDNPSADKQTQFEHKEGENRPSTGAADSALYEDDKYTEESQSWISGTPTSAGTFECRVFAFKDANLIDKASGKHPSNLVYQFKKNAKTDAGKKSLFEGNIVDSNTWKTDDIKPGIDWDYKSVTIEVKSNKPPEPKPPKIGDNDLTLKVYPFKNGDGSLPTALTSSNNKVSAILGMSLKPFVDATSAADSKNKITLRVLCSKGEKKDAAGGSGASTGSTGSTGSSSAVGGSNGGTAVGGSTNSTQSVSQPAQPSESSQPSQPSGSSQAAEATWSSNPDGLGLSGVPADTDQTRCKKGDTGCTAAAQTTMEVSIKPTKAGDYQCVVYALKPEALTAFKGVTANVTPNNISAAFAKANLKASINFAQLAFYIRVRETSDLLPHTGEWNWNLQLGAIAAVMVSVLAAGFVASQSDSYRKLFYERRRC